MGILTPTKRKRNTRILGNTHPFYKFLVLAFLIAFGLIIISALSGCNSATLDQNVKHYQERAVQVMHVTRDQAFGSEENTYVKLYKYWREENAEERLQANNQSNLIPAQAHNPDQLLSPGGSNSPVGVSEWGAPSSDSMLPIGTL